MFSSDIQSQNKPGSGESSRRAVLQSVAAGSASVVGLAGAASAEKTNESLDSSTDVQRLEYDITEAKQALKDASTSRMFRSLAKDGYISKPSIEAIPFDELDGAGGRGGIDFLRVNGNQEQYKYHIPVENGRLEIMLPLTDYVPNAYVHLADGREIVYAPGNNYRGKALEAEQAETVAVSQQDDVTEECSSPYYRSCSSCVTCCGITNWSRNEKKILCPDCWLTDCQWVKESCC